MNKKGYTLIEVIVSIMILSIASITLAGAFGNVIHFMSNSNKVKNASDEMFEVIEGADKNLNENVKVKNSIDVRYSIFNNNESIFLQVDGTLNSYYVDNGSDILLSNLVNKTQNKFYETPEYKNLCSSIKQLIADKDKQIEKVCFDVWGNDNCNLEGYDGSFFKSITENGSEFSFPKFPDELLPVELRSKGTSYDIFICYPWEIEVGDKQVSHGGFLIYLRPHGRGEVSNSINDTVKIICDYTTNAKNTNDPFIWYYIKEGNESILLRYFTENKITGQSDLSYNGDFTKYTSWDSFRNSLTMSDSKWYKLDTDKTYDPENYNKKEGWIDDYWVPVTR